VVGGALLEAERGRRMEALTRYHCGFKCGRPPKGAKQSPDVRRKGVGRANLTAPKLFEDMLKVNFSVVNEIF
jgi:hypothetical protein